jgi:hypothetical protein
MGGYDMAYDLAHELTDGLERAGVAVPDGAVEEALGGPFGFTPDLHLQEALDRIEQQPG